VTRGTGEFSAAVAAVTATITKTLPRIAAMATASPTTSSALFALQGSLTDVCSDIASPSDVPQYDHLRIEHDQGVVEIVVSEYPSVSYRIAARGDTMNETLNVAQYFYLHAPQRPGEAARLLGGLRESGVNLLALSGFPAGRRAQIDLVPEDPAALRAAARRHGWKLTGPKKVLLLSGEDRVGAMADVAERLAAAKVNIVATQAVATGPGVYSALLWVAPKDVNRAVKVLKSS
jgi:hypothetical protein